MFLSGHRLQAAFGRCNRTVNKAGRLLSFSISLGIPILSQRTRKFSLHELKQDSQSEITLSEATRETEEVK